MLSGERFGQLFETLERTAFRLEKLSVYDMEEEREEFERFLALANGAAFKLPRLRPGAKSDGSAFHNAWLGV
ncbi:DUF6879 family protein [Streptomyces sp. NPDC049944]|uniref:DUF6879 family protein n=1 Tax=Streptomyces sp. NPDC049944 TaxID=3155657 RepID=UPI0034485A3C